jgi:hypothetical protein
MKAIEILKNDKKVLINRTKLSDGYNYYITVMVFSAVYEYRLDRFRLQTTTRNKKLETS